MLPGCRVDQRRRGADGDDLARLSELELHVQRVRLLGDDLHIVEHFLLEPRKFDRQHVGPRRQSVEDIHARLVRDGFQRSIRFLVGQGDRYAGHHGTLWISHRALQAGAVLSAGWRRGKLQQITASRRHEMRTGDLQAWIPPSRNRALTAVSAYAETSRMTSGAGEGGPAWHAGRGTHGVWNASSAVLRAPRREKF